MVPLLEMSDTHLFNDRPSLRCDGLPARLAGRAKSGLNGRGQSLFARVMLYHPSTRGLAGLSLFVGVSFFSGLTAWRAIGAARAVDPEIAVYGQAWLAALASTMLVIATTSSVVAQVAEVHWLLCGMCVGFARSVAAARLNVAAPAPADDPPAPPPARKAAPNPSISAKDLPPHLRQYADREK